MDPWKEYAALQECRDAVCQWAELEGKSTQMAEDLVREHSQWTDLGIGTHALLAACARFAAWAIETLWHVTRK